MLDQSKSTRVQKPQQIHSWAFANQFSQVKEAERSAEHPLPHSDIISLEEQPTRGSMEQSFSGEETLIQSQFPLYQSEDEIKYDADNENSDGDF